MLHSLSKSAEHTLSRHWLPFTDNALYLIMDKGTNLMYTLEEKLCLHIQKSSHPTNLRAFLKKKVYKNSEYISVVPCVTLPPSTNPVLIEKNLPWQHWFTKGKGCFSEIGVFPFIDLRHIQVNTLTTSFNDFMCNLITIKCNLEISKNLNEFLTKIVIKFNTSKKIPVNYFNLYYKTLRKYKLFHVVNCTE